MPELNTFRDIAIIFIYTILLGTSAFEKFKTLSVPSWFLKQFEKTFLGKHPKIIKLSYWKIAVLELLLTILFVASLFFPGLLGPALVISMMLFAVLCFGLRISYDYQGSANMFTYFTASLISLFIVMHH